MKLVICSRDVDATLVKGDLISWHEDGAFEGTCVGLFNALTYQTYQSKIDYDLKAPFTILNLPLVTYDDIRPVFEDVVLPVDDDAGEARKWKIDDSNLERRPTNSTYPSDDSSETRARWLTVLPDLIRRDTLNAYREITRPDTVIADILVAR